MSESFTTAQTNKESLPVSTQTPDTRPSHLLAKANGQIDRLIAAGLTKEAERDEKLISYFPTPEYREELLELVKKNRM